MRLLGLLLLVIAVACFLTAYSNQTLPGLPGYSPSNLWVIGFSLFALGAAAVIFSRSDN